jgi:hypothetical protein
VLWYTGKKVNTAFRRIAEKREAVGHFHKAETPEQEAERVQRELAAASAANDIATMIKIIARTSSLTVSDYIQKTVGHVMFTYFTYVDNFHTYPRTLDDIVDGILYMEAKQYIQKQSREE